MKTFILFAFFSLFVLASCGDDTVTNNTTPPPTTAPVVQIVSWNYDNYFLTSDVDFIVTLKNSGNAAATNINLRFTFVASNPPNAYTDTAYFSWGSTLNAGQQLRKTFTYTLQSGYDVSSAQLRVTY